MPKGIFKRTKEMYIGRGKNISSAKLGRPSGHLGRKRSEETRQKISKAQKGLQAGSKHHNYKGGISLDENGKIDMNLYHKRKKEKQAGRPRPELCEICGNGGRICYDHNHETGNFRGWICHRCNVILGLAKEETVILNNLIEYLNKNASN